ncbi:hypothetical protein [Humisphaera borealis]|uniref:Uncharacterized protein n=1 Tax=Humisphaera borealis TaxID=2807512 RepID=A0A7M2WZA3_9BACT|nr:hypothetical protein [Humisphaera borealis]QOV90694.1 hypothetical protein IPV69_04870 [Humisphaera borealis]
MLKLAASFVFTLSAAVAITGCKDDHGHSQDGKPTSGTQATPAAKENHPNQVVIGELATNGLKIKAMQDEPVKPGGEGAFDLQITGYPAGGKPKAVRFWVGSESGEGSAKAKAEEETPDNWHTHAEVPKPIPAGSKFWAEIEPATEDKFKVSFELAK